MRIRLSQLKSIIREEIRRVKMTLDETEFKGSPHWSGKYGHLQMPRNISYVAESIKTYVDGLTSLMVDKEVEEAEDLVRTNLQEVFMELLKSGPGPLGVDGYREAKRLAAEALKYIFDNRRWLSEDLAEGTDRVKVVEELIFNVFTSSH